MSEYKLSSEVAARSTAVNRVIDLLDALIDAPDEVSDSSHIHTSNDANQLSRTISRLEGGDDGLLNWPFSKTEVTIAYENHKKQRYETFAVQLSWLITRPGEAGRPFVKRYVIDVLPGGEMQTLMTVPLIAPELTESPDTSVDRAEERPMTVDDFELLAEELGAMNRYVQGSTVNDWPAAEDRLRPAVDTD